MTFFLLVGIAGATNVGVVVDFPNGTIFRQCVNVGTGASAYTTMKESKLTTTWSGSGVLAFLESIDGIYNIDPFYWSFWHNNGAGTDFIPAQVGFGGHIVGDTTVIGSTYTEFYPNATPITKPTWFAYSDVCENKIDVRDIKVYVDGDKDSGADEGGGDFEVKPQSNVRLKIDIENKYDEDEDIDIEDIQVSAIIYDIDDGDDLEEEADEFDLDAEEHEVVELEFEIPLEVEEDEFDMELTVEGEDEDGLEFSQTIEFTVQVEKEKHEVILYKLNLVPSEISCEERANLNVQIYNLGTKEEDDVEFSVANEQLGINFHNVFDLDNDPFDDESWFKKTYYIEVPDDAQLGTYALLMTLTYDDGKRTDTDQIDLLVNECSLTPQPEPEPEEPVEEETEEEVVRTYVQPAVVTKTKKSFYEKYPYTVWIIGLDLALAVVLMLLFVVKASRK